jgi:hypothetical protein
MLTTPRVGGHEIGAEHLGREAHDGAGAARVAETSDRAGISGGGCGARSTMVTRSVRDPGDGLAHSSELDVVVRDAAAVTGPLGPRLAEAALCGGEL